MFFGSEVEASKGGILEAPEDTRARGAGASGGGIVGSCKLDPAAAETPLLVLATEEAR